MTLTMMFGLALAGLLLAIIWFDLRYLRIPNILVMLLVALFVLRALLQPAMAVFWPHLGLALGVFGLTFVLFTLRMMGGGDTKILPALALFVPLGFLPQTLLIFAAALIICTLFVMALRRLVKPSAATQWRFMASHKMPMGLPIGLSGLVVLALM